MLTLVADQDGERRAFAVFLCTQSDTIPVLQIRKTVHVGDVVAK